ncbi:membrane protein insertase YidC [Edaphobacter albus]|uniref:membrane protein insertase YidC n=1 Tax=Edaphobacter sp. 4G125 TaxID=2763071 RepID=UPI001648A3AF|nr:membrane protein insertase YidC [Edaphobacter sp. 4G125]QNI37017.1 membrane protein insertase YidC [Edaphobacter sp. 4G125]
MAEFKNPNQQGGGGQDGRSLFVVMFFMIAVFFGLSYYRQKTNPKTVSPNSQAAQTQSATQPQQPATPSPSVPAPDATSQRAPEAAAAGPVVQAAAESTTVVENELYRIEFTNRGAQVKSWVLKQYKDTDGHPLNLVHTQAAEKFGYPLSLHTYDAGTNATLASAFYVPSATGQLTAPAKLTFQYSANGLEVTKTFSFDETYVLHVDVQVTRNGSPVRALLSWPGGFGDQDTALGYAGAQIDYSRDSHDEHIASKKVSGGETMNGPFDWAGVSDTYFAAIFLPDSPASASLVTLHNELDVAKTIHRSGFGSTSRSAKAIDVSILGAAFGDTSGHTQTRLFVGPKAINVLKNIYATSTNGTKISLSPLLEFGFWGVIGKFLFLCLQWIHLHVVSNWGWAIILLTLAINILLLPTRIKTMQSGLKMQRIQPQMDAIKERYKKYKINDPKRNEMNAEIMKLQKDNGVNMFGGCIPTLIQLPLLFAFYSMLPKVVELRHAHWAWLPDLTASDPYYILPIVMVISQFLMQYYTPSPGVDPQQQKMMAFTMPLVTGYFVLTYASGLGLYWATSNFFGIAQQWVMNQTSLGKEMREIAAKRARRKAGAPVIQGKR